MMPHPALRAARRAPRLLAAASLATAVAVLAAPLASIEHDATVRHVTCLEHGELIDAAPLSPAEASAPAHHHARTVAEQGHGAPGASEHDAHCLLATWSTERSTPAQHLAQGDAAPPHRDPPLPAPSAPRPAAIALYRLAPKLSPPRA